MINKILYHENNLDHPYLPQEDMYANKGNVYVVADGVTHDVGPDGMYPIPSDAAKVAELICIEISNFLLDKDPSLENIKKAFEKANTAVAAFNLKQPLYIDRKNNGFNIGAATVAMAWINGDKLLYGVLDDSFISVFSDDYVDHPSLKPYVEQSAKILNDELDWANLETRRIWREDMRNNVYVYKDKTCGYGVMDGREGYEQYLQVGEVNLKPGDLVCVYTDGFIKMLKNLDFVKTLREKPFTQETFKYISNLCKETGNISEKTGYFIKI